MWVFFYNLTDTMSKLMFNIHNKNGVFLSLITIKVVHYLL